MYINKCLGTNQRYTISPIRGISPNVQASQSTFGNRDVELFKSPRCMNEEHQIPAQSVNMQPHRSDNYYGLIDFLEQRGNFDLLARKSAEERRTWFGEYLVADEPLELCESQASEPKLVERALRTFMSRADNGELERQFAEEARQVFYEGNTFVVWSGILERFLRGSYGDETSRIPVCELVRTMTMKFTSYVEIFEFLEQAVRKRRRLTRSVPVEVDYDRARHGTSPGMLRTLRVVLKILQIILYYIIKQMFLSFVRSLVWIGKRLTGRYTEAG
jgi:hypothetical protein